MFAFGACGSAMPLEEVPYEDIIVEKIGDR